MDETVSSRLVRVRALWAMWNSLKVELCAFLSYSYLNATIGLTRTARRAGM